MFLNIPMILTFYDFKGERLTSTIGIATRFVFWLKEESLAIDEINKKVEVSGILIEAYDLPVTIYDPKADVNKPADEFF